MIWWIIADICFFSGPINTLAVHPQGKAYASGAEDGFVRIHWVSSFVYLFMRLNLEYRGLYC